jgi:FHS family L-fucose permease-like MFS transporter
MGFFKKSTLRHRDDKRTRAAELTLRESIYPLMLVTVLFFLWVCKSPIPIPPPNSSIY